MSRRAGVSPDQTRHELLEATLNLLLERGFGGLRTSDIANQAGVSTGAIYSQFGSKVDLLVAAICERAPRLITEHLASGGHGPILDLFGKHADALPERSKEVGPLILEIIMSARRDPRVAGVVNHELAGNESVAAEAIRVAQSCGEVDDQLNPEALARLSNILMLGSLVAGSLGLVDVDHDAWNTVIGRVLDAMRAPIV